MTIEETVAQFTGRLLPATVLEGFEGVTEYVIPGTKAVKREVEIEKTIEETYFDKVEVEKTAKGLRALVCNALGKPLTRIKSVKVQKTRPKTITETVTIEETVDDSRRLDLVGGDSYENANSMAKAYIAAVSRDAEGLIKLFEPYKELRDGLALICEAQERLSKFDRKREQGPLRIAKLEKKVEEYDRGIAARTDRVGEITTALERISNPHDAKKLADEKAALSSEISNLQQNRKTPAKSLVDTRDVCERFAAPHGLEAIEGEIRGLDTKRISEIVHTFERAVTSRALALMPEYRLKPKITKDGEVVERNIYEFRRCRVKRNVYGFRMGGGRYDDYEVAFGEKNLAQAGFTILKGTIDFAHQQTRYGPDDFGVYDYYDVSVDEEFGPREEKDDFVRRIIGVPLVTTAEGGVSYVRGLRGCANHYCGDYVLEMEYVIAAKEPLAEVFFDVIDRNIKSSRLPTTEFDHGRQIRTFANCKKMTLGDIEEEQDRLRYGRLR